MNRVRPALEQIVVEADGLDHAADMTGGFDETYLSPRISNSLRTAKPGDACTHDNNIYHYRNTSYVVETSDVDLCKQ